MKKSDLRTGMFVTVRNGNHYYVMLNTGMGGEMENVLVHKVGKNTGWMPLSSYDEDMLFHDEPDDILPSPSEEDDHAWDIVRVDGCTEAAWLYCRETYKLIWKRKRYNG